ncbi:MAG: transglycosylase SLT domain-containing protein [Candidatus Omnitrophota bacterium]
MANRQNSNVDVWLKLETEHSRKALENASRHFDDDDVLTVNTLEAIYGQESSFGKEQRKRGITAAAGHFHFESATAKEYNLTVSKENDQRFDIDYASSAAARYLKDLNTMFAKETILTKDSKTIPVLNSLERKNFVLGAYNGGQRRVADAQYLAQEKGKNPQLWNDVKEFLEAAGATKNKAEEIRGYIEKVLFYEAEFAQKSSADKNSKQKEGKKPRIRCTEGHWVTIDDHPVFICD